MKQRGACATLGDAYLAERYRIVSDINAEFHMLKVHERLRKERLRKAMERESQREASASTRMVGLVFLGIAGTLGFLAWVMW